MTRWIPLVLGLAVAAGCVRLGIWQLDRLGQRRAQNAEVERQLARPVVALDSLVSAEPAREGRYRRVRVTGVFDFQGELVEMARPYQGAPGVYLVTPLRSAGGATVLVQRGWAYSPDARTVDRAALAERESTTVEGVLLPPRTDPQAVRPDTLGADAWPLVLRRTVAPPGVPRGLVALEVPAPDEGPHLSYAVQWFLFGTIALGGGVLLAVRGAGGVRPPA